MRKVFLLLSAVLIVCAMVACNKGAQNANEAQGASAPAQNSAAAASTAAPAGDDAMTSELQKLAGSGASDCGRIGPGGDVMTASECAMKANAAKKSFYVRYDLPMEGGMYAIGTAGAADGKLTTIQFDSKGFEQAPEKGVLSADKKMVTQPCDPKNPLRVASSGRVTCFPPSNMGAGATMGGASPHGGMGGGMMPPAQGANPHGGGMKTPPAPMGDTTKSH